MCWFAVLLDFGLNVELLAHLHQTSWVLPFFHIFWNLIFKIICSVTSDACDYERCSVNRGDRLLGSVYFTPESAYTAINVTTDAYIYGMWTELEYEYPLNDVCQALFRGDQQVSCPTEPHQEYRWNLDFLINPVIPQLSNVPIQCENYFYS